MVGGSIGSVPGQLPAGDGVGYNILVDNHAQLSEQNRAIGSTHVFLRDRDDLVRDAATVYRRDCPSKQEFAAADRAVTVATNNYANNSDARQTQKLWGELQKAVDKEEGLLLRKQKADGVYRNAMMWARGGLHDHKKLNQKTVGKQVASVPVKNTAQHALVKKTTTLSGARKPGAGSSAGGTGFKPAGVGKPNTTTDSTANNRQQQLSKPQEKSSGIGSLGGSQQSGRQQGSGKNPLSQALGSLGNLGQKSSGREGATARHQETAHSKYEVKPHMSSGSHTASNPVGSSNPRGFSAEGGVIAANDNSSEGREARRTGASSFKPANATPPSSGYMGSMGMGGAAPSGGAKAAPKRSETDKKPLNEDKSYYGEDVTGEASDPIYSGSKVKITPTEKKR